MTEKNELEAWGESPAEVSLRLEEAWEHVRAAERILREYPLVAERYDYHANAPFFGLPGERAKLARWAAESLSRIGELADLLSRAYSTQPMVGEGDGLRRIRMGKDAEGWRVPAESDEAVEADDGRAIGEEARARARDDWKEAHRWATPLKWETPAAGPSEGPCF